VLDDSVFALYRFVAWYARPVPRALAAIYPRSGRREALTVQDLGLAATTLNLIFIPLLYAVVRTLVPGGGKGAAERDLYS